MSGYSEKALMKLNRDELIAIIQKQVVKHGKHEEQLENLVVEVGKLTSSFAKLESELAISTNVPIVLLEILVQMERWANAQYSRREYSKVVGIASSVHHNQLKDKISRAGNQVLSRYYVPKIN